MANVLTQQARAAAPMVVAGSMPAYAAVIRAYQCTPMLEALVRGLRAQSAPPAEIIVVDSSHSEETAQAFVDLGVTVAPYPEAEFNYSRAINVGVDINAHDYTLIISSHIRLQDPDVIRDGWADMEAHGVEAGFFTYLYPDGFGQTRLIVLDKHVFDGRNGISNSMSLLPTARLRERPFRPEVFSAEDQEWTRYYLRAFRRPILRMETKRIAYDNPNHSGNTWSLRKLLNEEIAIGHFVNRRLLMPDRIALRFARGVLAGLRGRPERARLHLGHAKALFMANFVMPTNTSRYF